MNSETSPKPTRSGIERCTCQTVMNTTVRPNGRMVSASSTYRWRTPVKRKSNSRDTRAIYEPTLAHMKPVKSGNLAIRNTLAPR